MIRLSRRPAAIVAIAAIVVAVAATRVGGASSLARVRAGAASATVVRVIDGDTVDVRLDSGDTERVRILGIDTPEVADPRRPVQCFGPEASARTKELLPPGRVVILEGDPTQDERDRYGRRLAHVFFGIPAEGGGASVNVGATLVAEGYARHYVYQRTPTVHGTEYAAAEATARASGAGLWSAETCDGRTTRRLGSDRGA